MCAGNRSGVRVHDDPMINSVAHQSSLFFIFSTLISEWLQRYPHVRLVALMLAQIRICLISNTSLMCVWMREEEGGLGQADKFCYLESYISHVGWSAAANTKGSRDVNHFKTSVMLPLYPTTNQMPSFHRSNKTGPVIRLRNTDVGDTICGDSRYIAKTQWENIIRNSILRMRNWVTVLSRSKGHWLQ